MFDFEKIRFQCQRCNYCCSKEPGFVFLTAQDIRRITEGLSIGVEEFLSLYCRRVEKDDAVFVSLKEKENFDCVFLTDKGCKIHDFCPSQCSSYPFWESIMGNKENWDKEAFYCPGINKGKCYRRKDVEKIMKEREKEELLKI